VLLVRTLGRAHAAAGCGARSGADHRPQHAAARTGTIQENIDAGLWAPRMGAALLSIFGGLALVLAMIGVYGVMSYR
jgi:hypothetical protein